MFRDGGRAARLAATLGLRVDPRGALPAMVEVYPHPARDVHALKLHYQCAVWK